MAHDALRAARFESDRVHQFNAAVAERIRRRFPKPVYAGSIPAGSLRTVS